MKIYESNFEVEFKEDDSPLTLADKKSHDTICSALALFQIPFLSEEGITISYDERKDWEYLWVVDPLDGTKEFIKKNVSIYFGSRNLKNSKVEFKIYRNIIGKIFTYILKILFEIEINDTQCGFKLYKKKVAKSIFAKIKDNGFIHDVEVFLLSKKYNYPVKELPVKWIHKKESKLNLLFDIFKMFFALIKIKKNI